MFRFLQPSLLKLLITLIVLVCPFLAKELSGCLVTAYMIMTDADMLKIIAHEMKLALDSAGNSIDSIEKNPQFSLFFQYKNTLEISAQILVAYLSSCAIVLLANYFAIGSQSKRARL